MMTIRSVSITTIALSVVLMLEACVPIAVGTAAVTTVAVVTDRRSVGRFVDDNFVETKLNAAMISDSQLRGKVHVNFTSMDGIVLVTGEAPTESLKQRVVGYAQAQKEVRQVVDELSVAEKSSLASRSNDSWITAKVKTGLVGTPNLSANRVKVKTENGVVYLMGRVTQVESDAAVEVARQVKGVQRVVKIFEIIE